MPDHAKTIADLYAANGRGGIPAIMAVLADDVAWEVPSGTPAQAAGVPWFRPGRGKAHAAKFFETIGQLTFNKFSVDGLHASGNRVFAEVTFNITMPGGFTFEDSVIHA